MRLQEHIDKISWTLADKMLYIIYGVVTILIARATDRFEFGLFGFLISLNTWIFVVGDAFALQNMIQFGVNEQNKKKVNAISLLILIVIGMVSSGLIYFFRYTISDIFGEPRLLTVAKYLPLLVVLLIPRTFTVKIAYRDYAFKKLFFLNLSFFGSMTLAAFYLIYTMPKLELFDIALINFIGAGISSVTGVILTFKELKFSLSGEIKYSRMFRFSFPLTFQATLHYLPKAIDVFIIFYFFGAGVVGVYNLAKTLFRIFDEAASASYGLIYPAAVRQIENKNFDGLKALLTKSISFLLLVFFIIVLILELGAGNFIITTFLPPTYHAAVQQFDVLVISALFIPFTMISLIINAFGNTKIVLKFVVISFIFSVAVFYIIGLLKDPVYVSLGLMAYYAMFGSLCYLYSYRHLNFKPMQLFRAFNDSINFIKPVIARISNRK